VYWRLPLRPNNYLWPGLWGHFALCFLPTLINGSAYDRWQVGLLFATGAALGFCVAYWGDPATAFDEGPGLWCLVAVPQHLITFLAALRYQHELKAGALARQAAGFAADAVPTLKLPNPPGAYDSEGSDFSLDDDDDDAEEEDDLVAGDGYGEGGGGGGQEPAFVASTEEEHALVAIGDTGVTQVRRRKRL
jgi:hypothetical protein